MNFEAEARKIIKATRPDLGESIKLSDIPHLEEAVQKLVALHERLKK